MIPTDETPSNPSGETMRDHEAVVLGVRDRETFVTALLDATAPAPRLRKAVRRYKTHHQHGFDAG